jgi:hypothetical protein
MVKVYNWFGGRSTFFCFWFVVVGFILAFLDKLSGTYLSMAGSIQLLLVTRAVAEDYFSGKPNGNGDK